MPFLTPTPAPKEDKEDKDNVQSQTPAVPSTSSSSNDSKKHWTIVGYTLGAIIFVALLFCIYWYLRTRKSRVVTNIEKAQSLNEEMLPFVN